MIRARPIASCCCWPPERSPPLRRSMVFRIGNSSKMCSGIRRWPRGTAPNPVCRFSSTVSSGKISRPCGTSAMPRRARSTVDRPVMSWPSHSILPGRRSDLAHDGAQGAGLADAVAAEHAGDLADHGGERHPPQRLAGAVVQVDAFDTQHAQRPR